MSLGGRLTVTTTTIVGLILAVGTLTCYLVVRGGLDHQMNEDLRQQATFFRQAATRGAAFPARLPPLPPQLTKAGPSYVQLIHSDGSVSRPGNSDGVALDVTADDRAVAQGRHGDLLQDRQDPGGRVRVVTQYVKGLGAVQVGRSLATVDQVLRSLRLVLGALLVGGVALAALATRLSSRPVLSPIADLAHAMSHIESTGDLSRRVTAQRTDEVGQLAARFNAMLDELQRAQDGLARASAAQRQLIADVSHELRTPITGLRTNIEVLLRADERSTPTPPILSDVLAQVEELSGIVSDVIELARGERQEAELSDLDLAEIVRDGIARSQRHAPSLHYDAQLSPWPMVGDAERLGRAVNNVLDNAAKFSPSGARISIVLEGGVLRVRDEGPGVSEPELAHIFDRFYRGRDASGVPGSGLGLAIVKQVLVAHGGSAIARSGPDGGLEIVLALPGGDAAPR